MAWTEFNLTVTSPLFNGNALDTGLHVSSMRGVLRYWFRALAAHHAGNDIAALAQGERKVFGSTRNPSPVRMRLSGQPDPSTLIGAGDTAFPRDANATWVDYLLGQGLSPYGSGQTLRKRPFTEPGHRFTLKIRFSGNEVVNSLFLASLWLACAYGGFGARTRKGFGGVRLTHKKGYLPPAWNEDTVSTPGLQHYLDLGHLPVVGPLEACANLLPDFMPVRRSDLAAERPHYPAIGEGHTKAATSTFHGRTWREVAGATGERYRRFRANRQHSTASYDLKLKTFEHQDVVIDGGDHFRLGALGLPVNFPGYGAVNVFENDVSLRRASPLWFRFVGGDGDEYRLFSFAFLNTFLPTTEGARVEFQAQGARRRRPLRVDDVDVLTQVSAWMESTHHDEMPDRIR
ncbi:type III-B CRISPR module RAMP protein Cmr1 [Nocardiopsis sp. NPDC006938]|uniref:type III-B CRISPR module RAMP protein Cmr1 n=1 Tax=Nocardiopsis sp. NPDC006938 TaxID=3364337 RepID=UPI0036984A62